MKQADEIDVFAEIEPNQKDRIILTLRHTKKCCWLYGGWNQ
jgi:magnesium-transporting ATPase (P-type)